MYKIIIWLTEIRNKTCCSTTAHPRDHSVWRAVAFSHPYRCPQAPLWISCLVVGLVSSCLWCMFIYFFPEKISASSKPTDAESHLDTSGSCWDMSVSCTANMQNAATSCLAVCSRLACRLQAADVFHRVGWRRGRWRGFRHELWRNWTSSVSFVEHWCHKLPRQVCSSEK